jgi:peptide/nickel transport system substrate-binding protein
VTDGKHVGRASSLSLCEADVGSETSGNSAVNGRCRMHRSRHWSGWKPDLPPNGRADLLVRPNFPRTRGAAFAVWIFLLPIIVLLTACRPQIAVPSDVLIVGQLAEPKSLDPQAATALNDFRIAANLFEGLVRFNDGTLEIGPALAESWSISDEGLTYRFNLRSDVKFHDGTRFNAEAVRFHFERILRDDHPFHDTGPFPLAFFFSSIQQIEAEDDFTVVFRLDEPFAPLLSNLASPSGLIVSPAAVKKWGKDFGRHPVGTGPFVFEEWNANQAVRIRRNDAYWDGDAKLREVIFRPLTDENARLTELLAGGCDLVVEVPPDIVTNFRKDPNFQTLEAAGPHLWFLIFNLKEGPFTDVRLRRAVNLAINKQALVHDLLQDTATVPAGPIPEAFKWASDPELQPYPYDPEKARRLVREVGKGGATLTLYATEGGSGMLAPRQMAAAIQADLAKVGLQVRIESFEWNTFLSRVNAGLEGKADMAEMAWMVNDPDTLPFLALRSEAWPDKGGFNSGYYSNPQVDELLANARSSADAIERGRLYRQVDRIVHDDAPWAFIASWKQNAVATANLHGLKLQPSFLFLLKDAWKDSTKRDMGESKRSLPLTRPSATLSPSDGERDGVRGSFHVDRRPALVGRRLPHENGSDRDSDQRGRQEAP